jgi:hypothetical protein
MKTLQVIWNGQEVGTRKSDLPYTWALVAHTFREADYRERMAKAKYHHLTAAYLDETCAMKHKPSVISYHGSAELAHAAAGAKRLDHLCCSISVVPVQVKAAKPRKSKLAPLAERLQDEGMYTNQLTTKADPSVVG